MRQPKQFLKYVCVEDRPNFLPATTVAEFEYPGSKGPVALYALRSNTFGSPPSLAYENGTFSNGTFSSGLTGAQKHAVNEYYRKQK